MKTELMLVTPEMAEGWLEKNERNFREKNLVMNRVMQLARDITSGNWKLTHQGIAIDDEGYLLDGQHRLTAIKLSGIPCMMMVTTGVPQESSVAMDCGRPRALAQRVHDYDRREIESASLVLSIMGVRYMSPTLIHRVMGTVIGLGATAIYQRCGSNKPIRSSAPVRAAAAVRWAEDPEYVEAQYAAFVNLNIEVLSPCMVALVRQVDSLKARASADRQSVFCRCWLAFAPANRDKKTVRLLDEKGVLQEIRSYLSTHITLTAEDRI